MLERRNRARFTIEALAELRVRRERRWKDLEGDNAIEASIPRAIHLTHSASPARGENLVRAEPESGVQCHPWESVGAILPPKPERRALFRGLAAIFWKRPIPTAVDLTIGCSLSQ